MMAWTYTAGSRSIEFSDRMHGVGLMRYPSIKLGGTSSMSPLPRSDGQVAGRDYLTGQVVSLDVEVRPDHRPVDEVWSDLLSAWRGDEVRMQGGEYATLRSDRGRITYGRPRPLDPSFEHWLYDVGRARLEFECIDDLWYEPEEAITVRMASTETGGLTFPAEAPFTFHTGPTERNGTLTVRGMKPVYPVFEIQGPIRDPRIRIPGVGELFLSVNLAFDQTLLIDTRPGRRRVARDGIPVPGALLPRGSRLSDMSVPVGTHEVVLRGTDATGTARLYVRVAPVFTTF